MEFKLLFLIFVLMFVAHFKVYSFKLTDKKIEIFAPQKFTVPKQEFISNNVNVRANGHLALLDDAKFTDLIAVITQSIDSAGSQVRSVRWRCEITHTLGTLKIVDIIANISEDSIEFVANGATITQPIPTQSDCREVCARTGRRKYGIAGPRKRKCNTICTERGLTQSEIDAVSAALFESVPSVIQQINKIN